MSTLWIGILSARITSNSWTRRFVVWITRDLYVFVRGTKSLCPLSTSAGRSSSCLEVPKCAAIKEDTEPPSGGKLGFEEPPWKRGSLPPPLPSAPSISKNDKSQIKSTAKNKIIKKKKDTRIKLLSKEKEVFAEKNIHLANKTTAYKKAIFSCAHR